MTGTRTSLFSNLPDPPGGGEIAEHVVDRPAGFIERIVSRGFTGPKEGWFDQDWDEWVVVLRGWGTVLMEDGEEHTLGEGEHLLIEAHRRHKVVSTSSAPSCLWLAVHFRGTGQGSESR